MIAARHDELRQFVLHILNPSSGGRAQAGRPRISFRHRIEDEDLAIPGPGCRTCGTATSRPGVEVRLGDDLCATTSIYEGA